MGNNPDILQADIPSVGTFTARGVAAMNAAILDGRLIDSRQLQQVTAVDFEGTDQVFGNHARLALGYPIGRIGTRPEQTPTTFGWVDGGGSSVYADTHHRHLLRHDQETAHPLQHRTSTRRPHHRLSGSTRKHPRRRRESGPSSPKD